MEPHEAERPASHELEVYRQAHETRRRWESFIWQYGALTLALIGLLATRMSALGGVSVLQFDLVGRVVVTLLALLLGSLFLNVFRARSLMKQIERTIASFHQSWRVPLPVVPYELDRQLPRFQRSISSTRFALWTHLVLFLTASVFAIMVWIGE